MKEEEEELQKRYTRGGDTQRHPKHSSKGGAEFKIRDAPWQNKESIEEDFPAIQGVEPPNPKWQPPSWGPKRKF